ncbi:hypothetical protein ACVWWQ_003048 [Rhodanobacter sp. TND4EL1]
MSAAPTALTCDERNADSLSIVDDPIPNALVVNALVCVKRISLREIAKRE